MKHFIIGVLILSFFSIAVHAQPGSVWLGAHVGADIANLSFDPALTAGETVTSGTGIAIGAEGDYWFSNNFGITAQLAYLQRNVTDNSSDGSPLTISFVYIQMPVLLKATFGSGAVKPFFFAGPEIGLKLSSKGTGKFDGRDTTIDFPDSLFTKFNIGILLGAGITYAVNPETMLYLEAGYDYGMSNINNQFNNQDNQKIFTRDIRASLGILFRIE